MRWFSKAQPKQAPQQKTVTRYVPVAVPMQRKFDGAKVDRLSSSWTVFSGSMDYELRTQLNNLRARARDLTQNNPYARKFVQQCSSNVVGPTGFDLKVRISETDANGKEKLDKLASDAIKKAFWQWAKRGNCDVTGYHSFFDLQNLYIKTMARDGEILIRKVLGKDAGPFGFQMQFLDIERLDVMRNEELGNGNIIKMGVEINPYGKPVAYWIRTKHPGDNPIYSVQGSFFERVPANLIYHHFVSDRPEQNRGIPWLHAAMVELNNLGAYRESAIVAARVGAAKMGFITSPDGDATALADDKDADGNLITEADPGQFPVLPEGFGFTPFNPDYPHAMFAEFNKACLRGIASAIGVSYNTLASDLEGVNFSSIRSGVLEERDNWMVVQNWMIENFLNDVFSTWLRMALLSGNVTMPNGSSLPASKFDKFNNGLWQGRRWSWVDPLKDVQANVLAINNGLRSRTSVISDEGNDFDDVMNQLADEQEKIGELGIVLEAPDQKVTNQQDATATSQNDNGDS